jgi:hypothetical protein
MLDTQSRFPILTSEQLERFAEFAGRRLERRIMAAFKDSGGTDPNNVPDVELTKYLPEFLYFERLGLW